MIFQEETRHKGFEALDGSLEEVGTRWEEGRPSAYAKQGDLFLAIVQ